jgi:lysophospholipase L1-like esterase
MKKFIAVFCCYLSACKQDIVKHTYLDNQQYLEQVAIFDGYSDTCAIALIGDSHIYKCHWDELLNTKTCNRGVGSDIVEGMYRRISHVIKAKPKYCFILGGANDIEYNIPFDTICFYYKAIIDTLAAHRITPIIMHVMHVGQHYPNRDVINSRGDELNRKLDKLNAKTIAINVEQQDLQRDQIHLMASGYRKWKDQIIKVLADDYYRVVSR